MKTKLILLLSLLFSLSITVNGQNRGNSNQHRNEHKINYEQFKQKKAEYIKKEVGLTESEAKAFLPLTDQLMQKKFELNKDLRKEVRELKNKKDKTDSDYESIVKKSLDIRIKEAELEKEYYQKFRKILSAEKIFKYQNAERKFMKKTVEKDK